MGKIGLLFQFIGFSMLFWRDEERVMRGIDEGGGIGTTPADLGIQMEKSLSFVHNDAFRMWLASNYHRAAFIFILLGILLQII